MLGFPFKSGLEYLVFEYLVHRIVCGRVRMLGRLSLCSGEQSVSRAEGITLMTPVTGEPRPTILDPEL